MADARERLADVPAEVVVTNHVMGLYELAAIHLSATPPDLDQAALAIDSVACLVEGLGDRLGADAPAMRDALDNIRMAFVQIKGVDETARRPAPAIPPDQPSDRAKRPFGAATTRPSRTTTSSSASRLVCSLSSLARSRPAALTTRHQGTSSSVVARMRPTSRECFG